MERVSNTQFWESCLFLLIAHENARNLWPVLSVFSPFTHAINRAPQIFSLNKGQFPGMASGLEKRKSIHNSVRVSNMAVRRHLHTSVEKSRTFPSKIPYQDISWITLCKILNLFQISSSQSHLLFTLQQPRPHSMLFLSQVDLHFAPFNLHLAILKLIAHKNNSRQSKGCWTT